MKKILMIMLDGIGVRNNVDGNALKAANMPNFNMLLEKYPHSLLDVSGECVGLTENQAGNAEVGYRTLASGKVIKQKSSYVHDFVDEDVLATNPAIKDAIEQVKKHKSTIHIVGLMSDGGITSNIDDTIKIIDFFKKQEVEVGVDFIADGKDSEPKSIEQYIKKIEEINVPIFTVCGRYYAMNDDDRWDRTKIYYDLIRNGVGLQIKELNVALKNCYMRNITDEYLPPMVVKPNKNIKKNDVVFWVNYNTDGAKQILMALTNPDEIKEFNAAPSQNVKYLMLYPVDPKINATVLINEENDISNSIGQYLGRLELTQARIGSIKSYEYVTTYFNGDSNDKIPKSNNYYIDLKEKIPGKELELNAAGISKQVIKCMEKDVDFILASFDAIDIVASTGNFEKTVQILEFIDECLGKIIESAELNFYTIVLLSTFGSAELMKDEEGRALTTHTLDKVPFIITDAKLDLDNGKITDVAPTVLSYMDIGIPESMKENKILIKN